MPANSNIIWSSVSSEPRLAGETLAVRVDRRAKRLRLRLGANGLVLTVPAGVSRRRALAWASGHEDWAAQALAARPEPLPIKPGATLPYRGQPHLLRSDAARRRGVTAAEGEIIVGGPIAGLEGRLLRWLRAEAKALLTRETLAFAAKAGVAVARVRVGDPKSRWGSCSTTGSIGYSWRLILAPDFVRRATVAHEVAHRVHMNHSPAFHALHATLLGEDPKAARGWLRRNGAALHRLG
jgi:predicted metal-dependent hydrolase